MHSIAKTPIKDNNSRNFAPSRPRLKPYLSKRRTARDQQITAHYNLITGKALTAFHAPKIAFDFAAGFFALAGYNLTETEPVEMFDETFARGWLGYTHKATNGEKDSRVTREAERRRKQREQIIRWQELDVNPLLFEYDSEFNKTTKKRNSKYIWYFAELVRDIAADAPLGSAMSTLNEAVAYHCSAYLQRFTGTAKKIRKGQTQTPESKFHRAATTTKNAIDQAREEIITRLRGEGRLEDAETEADFEVARLLHDEFFSKFDGQKNAILCNALGVKFNEINVLNGLTTGKTVRMDAGEIGYSLIKNRVANSEEGAILPENFLTAETSMSDVPKAKEWPKLELGLSVEDFIASNPAYPKDDQPPSIPWADQTPTDKQIRTLRLFRAYDPVMSRAQASARIDELKTSGAEPFATDVQRDLLARGGVVDDSLTISQASAKIADLLASGAFVPDNWFSLTELQSFDPKARHYGKAQRRFCCPLCNGSRRKNSEHRSLSANTKTGVYYCQRCQTSGVLREFCDSAPVMPTVHSFPVPQPETPVKTQTDDKWRKWVASAVNLTGTAGAAYLDNRVAGLADVAKTAGVKFGQWWRANADETGPEQFPAVIFPIHNEAGEMVAATARAIADATKRTKGNKSEGVFLATPNALDAPRVAICEAPIDALALAACGLAAIALVGTSWPEWLPGRLAGKTALTASDVDQAGDECAAGLADELTGATVIRIRPNGAKDWAELAERYGLETVAAQLEFEHGESGESDEMHNSSLFCEVA